jgi:hypothetical protein
MRYRLLCSVLSLLLVCGLSSHAAGASLNQLLSDLTGTNQAAQTQAVQALANEGVDALPALLPLLSHGDPMVAKAASLATSRIANRYAAKDAESRLHMATLFTALLSADQSRAVRETGLRLIALCAPASYDCDPVGALLQDGTLHDPARTALERINSQSARNVLHAALSAGTPSRATAIVRSLTAMRALNDHAELARFAQHDDEGLRAAVALALAQTGDPAFADTLQNVRARATAETAARTADAQLRYAEAMVLRGGNWQHAMTIFLALLDASESTSLKSAAMAGLGRFGDGEMIAPMVAATGASNGELDAALVQALRAMHGREPSKRMALAYASLDRRLQVRLLDVFGDNGDASVLPILADATWDEDMAFRRAGIGALARTGHPEAVSALTDIVNKGLAEDRAEALAALGTLAIRLSDTGERQAAGVAYTTLLRLSEDTAEKQDVLRGLATNPVAGALDAVMAALQQSDLKAAAIPATIAVAAQVAKAGDTERALAAYDGVRAADGSLATIAAIAPRVRALGAPFDAAGILGVITAWHLAGPFAWIEEMDWEKALAGEPEVDLNAELASGNQTLTWKKATSSDDVGIINLVGELAQVDRSFAYAYAEIDVPRETAAVARIGSDDGYRFWLNGELVAENKVDRGVVVDQDSHPITLKAGRNALLLKISQGGGGWGFCLRLTDGAGNGVQFTSVAEPTAAAPPPSQEQPVNQ